MTWLYIEHLFFYYPFNNFSALVLCEINVLDVIDMGEFFSEFYYIAKYWNSNRIKILIGNVRAIHS